MEITSTNILTSTETQQLNLLCSIIKEHLNMAKCTVHLLLPFTKTHVKLDFHVTPQQDQSPETETMLHPT
jgi:hypothetical protein